MLNERGELEFALPGKAKENRLDFSGMTDRQKTDLYLKMVRAMADIISGASDECPLDHGDVNECYKEFQNVIFNLREQWGAI